MRQRSLSSRSRILGLLLGLGALVYAPAAQAVQLYAGSISSGVTGTGYNVSWTFNGHGESGYAGELPASFISSSRTDFFIYCVDLTHSFTVPSNWTVKLIDKNTPFTGYGTQTYGQAGHLVTNAGEIGYLINRYSLADSAGGDHGYRSAALQLAIWELEYGNSFVPGFPLINPPADLLAIKGYYDSYVAEAAGRNQNAVFFDPQSGTNTGGTPQAFVGTPEPSTLVLWGSVMIGLAGIRRIKRGSIR